MTLVASRVVVQRGSEGDDARLHLARQGADEARVEPTRAHRSDWNVRHQAPMDRVPQLRLDAAHELYPAESGELGGELRVDSVCGVVPAPLGRL